jgi:diguanylate cyclase (GGDEF)-like protein
MVVVVDDLARLQGDHGPAGLSEVLRVAGQRIRETLRQDDFTARWGGEQLVVVLRNVTFDDAVEVGQRIRLSISRPIVVHDGTSIVPTTSIGCAAGDGGRIEELVDRAHTALALAKASGGNCVRRALPAQDRWMAGVAAGR